MEHNQETVREDLGYRRPNVQQNPLERRSVKMQDEETSNRYVLSQRESARKWRIRIKYGEFAGNEYNYAKENAEALIKRGQAEFVRYVA